MRLVRFERVPAMKADRAARILQLPSDGELFHALRVYSWQEKDVGISELWLDTKRFANLTAEKLAHHEGSLYQFYERELGVTIVSAEDRLRAKLFTPALASLGQFMTGEPYLELTRIGKTFGNVPVEYRLSYCTTEEFYVRM